MIDIHSHVLFGLDDGARTIEDSIAMAKMAAQHGTTDLVATPHANPTYTFSPETISARLAELQAAIGDTLTLHTGCDFHLSFDNIQDAVENPQKYTIDHGRYLMVEFSDLLIFHNTADIFARLQEAGMTPVITHPERNALLRQRLDKIGDWVESGARVQVTAQSLTGGFGRRAQVFSKDLLDRNLLHVIASDGHDVKHRPPVMDGAFAWLESNVSREMAELLCIYNPGCAFSGADMELPEMSAAPGKKKWFQLWR